MATFGIMGTLLTLGAIDFGVVVDDTIVMVENVARKLAELPGQRHDRKSRNARLATIIDACCQVRKPMLVGHDHHHRRLCSDPHPGRRGRPDVPPAGAIGDFAVAAVPCC